MIKIPYEDIVARIREKTSLSEEEISARVREKTEMLAGLVSREGAAHIIANELGVKLIDAVSGKFKIDKIYDGMRDVEVVAKVLRMYEAKSFNTNGRAGMVGSLLIGDDTGMVRLVLWNEQATQLERLREGSIIRVSGAYVKSRDSGVELHLGIRGELQIDPPGVTVINVKELDQQKPAERKRLADITPEDSLVEVVATIVQLFDLRFFEVCGRCGKRARRQDDGSVVCSQHGTVEPSFSYVANAFIDDGTENMRLVCFREQASALLGREDAKIQKFRESPEGFEPLSTELLGSVVRVVGRIKNNELFNRLELVAQSVEAVDPSQEIARLESQ